MIQARLAALRAREQIILAAGSVCAALLLYVLLLHQPLSERLEAARRQHLAATEALRTVSELAREHRRLAAAAARAREGGADSLSARVNASLQAQGLRPGSIQPGSGGGLRLRLDDAAFADVLAWLADLEARGIGITDLSITPAGAAGQVNLALLLEAESSV